VKEIQNLGKGDIRQTEANLFFIVGTSRSGSSLLQAMLNSHSEIVIPPETHFFYYEREYRRRLRSRLGSSKIEDLANFLFDERQRLADLNINRTHLLAACQEYDIVNPYKLFSLVLTQYRLMKGAVIAGEKTPRHILFTNDLAQKYPRAKFLFLFRDPRAKAESERRAPFGSSSVFISSRRWRRYTDMYKRFAKEHNSDRHRLLLYRDLVKNPEETLHELAQFLDVKFEEGMLRYYERSKHQQGFPKRESWKKGTWKPIQESYLDRWRDRLDPKEIALIEYVAGSQLDEMKYVSYQRQKYRKRQLLTTWLKDYKKGIW
jgi:hypothetical protein